MDVSANIPYTYGWLMFFYFYLQKIKLLQEGGADDQEIILAKAKYQGQMQTYKDFSEKMNLPEQKKRIMQDGLNGKFMPTKAEQKALEESTINDKIKAVNKKGVSITGNKLSELYVYSNDSQE